MKHLRFVALSLCVIGLAGCQTFDGVVKDIESIKLPSLNNASLRSSKELVYSGGCPQVESVSELETLAEFSDLSDPADHNLISRIDIAKIQNACSYDENAVTIDLRMEFQGKLGPQGRSPSSNSYPFFVAVTSASGDILAKEVFAASMNYGPGENMQSYTEKMRQIIPIDRKRDGARYKVLVGFQLTPDQLAYNRMTIRQEALRLEAEKMKQSKFEKAPMQVQEQAQKEIYIGRPVDITP